MHNVKRASSSVNFCVYLFQKPLLKFRNSHYAINYCNNLWTNHLPALTFSAMNKNMHNVTPYLHVDNFQRYDESGTNVICRNISIKYTIYEVLPMKGIKDVGQLLS